MTAIPTRSLLQRKVRHGLRELTELLQEMWFAKKREGLLELLLTRIYRLRMSLQRIFASEDIGLAGNGALNLATNCFMAVERVGMPESGLILAHVATVLAKAKKSRQTTDAWYKALDIADKTMGLPVPIWLRNAPTKLMKDLGFGKGQKWEAGFHLDKNYLPDDIKDEKIF